MFKFKNYHDLLSLIIYLIIYHTFVEFKAAEMYILDTLLFSNPLEN